MSNIARSWSAARKREHPDRDRSGPGRGRARVGAGVAAAILLAVRDPGAGRGAGGDRLPMAVHDLDELQRMEGWLADHFRGLRELPAAADRPALCRGDRPYAG